MKHNKSSIEYQQRSIDREDKRFDHGYWGGAAQSRQDRRRDEKRFHEKMSHVSNSIFKIMSSKDKLEYFKSFICSTNGRWTTEILPALCPEFVGNFDEFIQFLGDEKGDETILKYKVKLRNIEINKIIN